MTDLIAISELNDFSFCPYSIYLHNVYEETDGDSYKATPQTHGSISHRSIEQKIVSTRSSYIMSLPVMSEQLGVYRKIDMFKQDVGTLIERKYNLKRVFQGQVFQLWAQYFCMTEMGYDVRTLVFYETTTHKTHPVPLPNEQGLKELESFILRFRAFDPASSVFPITPNKCAHCIYCNLCDHTESANVYS